METNQLLQADVLDIIFEGRNKAYGAYELRKTYNKRLKAAVSVMIICCLLAFLFAVAGTSNSYQSSNLIVSNDVTLIDKIEEPKQPPVPPPLPVQEQIATIKFNTPKLTNDPIETPPPVQTDMANIAISDVDNPDGVIKDVVAPPKEKEGTGIAVAPQKNEFEGEVFTVQVEARFPGGTEAWRRFLERNLKAETPLDNGAPAGTYSVVVSFLVDKEGNISEVKALTDPGYGIAAEAVRTIQRGPKWIPTLQNGRNVIYRQKQLITFQVQDAP